MNEVAVRQEKAPFAGEYFNSILVLVDVSNIYLSARDNYGYAARVDFRKLRELALKPTERRFKHILCRAYSAAKPDQAPEQFLTALEKIGFEVITMTIRTHDSGVPSATNIDVQLAKDAVTLKVGGEYPDIVVVASGDSDFVPVYRDLKARGSRVEIISFPQSLGGEVIHVVDAVTKLDRNIFFTKTREYSKAVVASRK